MRVFSVCGSRIYPRTDDPQLLELLIYPRTDDPQLLQLVRGSTRELMIRSCCSWGPLMRTDDALQLGTTGPARQLREVLADKFFSVCGLLCCV